MTPTNAGDRLYVRPSPEARHALKTLLAALQAPSRFGADLTQEDLVSATWLWLAGMDAGEVGIKLAPFVEEVRAWRREAKRPAGEAGGNPAAVPARPAAADVPGSEPLPPLDPDEMAEFLRRQAEISARQLGRGGGRPPKGRRKA